MSGQNRRSESDVSSYRIDTVEYEHQAESGELRGDLPEVGTQDTRPNYYREARSDRVEGRHETLISQLNQRIGRCKIVEAV